MENILNNDNMDQNGTFREYITRLLIEGRSIIVP